MVGADQECMVKVDQDVNNMWQSFKYRFKRLWYFILRKEWKTGWVMTGPHVVILNDEAISKIDVDK